MLIVIVLGSIYGGIASPTEAAAVSAVYAFLVSVFGYRDMGPLKGVPWRHGGEHGVKIKQQVDQDGGQHPRKWRPVWPPSQMLTTINAQINTGNPAGFRAAQKPYSLTNILSCTMPADWHAGQIVLIDLLSRQQPGS